MAGAPLADLRFEPFTQAEIARLEELRAGWKTRPRPILRSGVMGVWPVSWRPWWPPIRCASACTSRLVTEPAPGRYQLHDLVREHAQTLAAADSPAESDDAAGRLLNYHLQTAQAAGRYFTCKASARHRPPPSHPPAQAPGVSTLRQAASWLDAERANLHAATDYAAGHGRPQHAIAIPPR